MSDAPPPTGWEGPYAPPSDERLPGVSSGAFAGNELQPDPTVSRGSVVTSPATLSGEPIGPGPEEPLTRGWPSDAATLVPDTDDRSYSHRNLFTRVLSDQKFLVTKWWPGEFRSARFASPMLVGIAAAVSSGEGQGVDQEVEGDLNGSVGGSLRGAAHDFTFLGNASTAGVLIGSMYVIGRWRGNDRLTETASLSTEAMIDAGIWVTVLKAATARTRPTGGGQGDFFQYHTQNGQTNGSFPSGHAMGAFAVSTVIAREYADRKWVPWVAYGTAGLIAASRVVLGRHFPSDVLVGAVLGNSVGRMVYARARGAEGYFPGQLAPYYDSRTHAYGMAWSRRW